MDVISVSLDAQDEKVYDRICSPDFKNAFHEVISFIKEAKQYIPDVQATVVEMAGVDVEKCRKITDELGVKLRVRKAGCCRLKPCLISFTVNIILKKGYSMTPLNFLTDTNGVRI